MATKADPYAGIDFDEINEATGENILNILRIFFNILEILKYYSSP